MTFLSMMQKRCLGMFNVGTGDKKSIGRYVIILPICDQLPITGRNIMDFVTVIPMAMGGNRPGKKLKYNIQRVDLYIFN